MDHNSSKRASSKRKPVGKGKKGIDEAEKVLTGAGWTLAATQKFLETPSDQEKIAFLLQMFSISEEDYKYDMKSTTTIDFNLANALFCQDKNFNVNQTQFVCRTIYKLLEHAISYVQGENYDFDSLRSQLYDEFQASFMELNSTEPHFTTDETKILLHFLVTSFLRPLRLFVHPYYIQRPQQNIQELRKVFQPVKPIPLSECIEEIPEPPEDAQFAPLILPHTTSVNLEEVKQMIRQYTDSVIQTIDKRYDLLEAELTHAIAEPENN